MKLIRGGGPFVLAAAALAVGAMAQGRLIGRPAPARAPLAVRAVSHSTAGSGREVDAVSFVVAGTALPVVRAPFSDTAEIRQPSASPAPMPAPLVDWDGAPIEAMAQPKSIQLISVPVPLALAEGGDVQYAIVPGSGARLLPPLSGVVAAAAVGRQPVVVAADVPASALAGVKTIAQVEYRQQGVLRGTIPVRLQVAQVRGAILRLAQSLLGARAGDRISLRYFLTNSGNAPDTIELRLIAPGGWRAAGLPTRYILAAGASVTGEATITIPLASGDGALRLRLLALSGGQQLAETDATVEVVRAGVLQTSVVGPQLTVGVASVLADQASSAPVFGFELQGPLTDALRVSGRLIQPTNSALADPLGLARVGYYLGGSYLSVASDRWAVTGGATGRTFSDITGLNIYGQGGSFTYDGPKWTADVLAAQPASGDQSGTGHLLGARVGAKVDGGWVGATATDFKESLFDNRQLQAFGVGGITPPFSGVTVSGELAARSFLGGSGLGWSAEVDHHSGSDYAQLRAEGAPGGTAAFARASQELSAMVSHGFGPLVLAGAAWSSDDQNPAFSKLRSTGISLAPQYAINDHTTVNAELRSNGYTAEGGAGTFGNSETALRLGATVHFGTFYTNGSVSFGQASRSTAFPSGPSVTTSAGRQSLQGTAGWATERGTFEANLMYEQDGAGVGFLPHQALLGLRAQKVSFLRDGGGPLLNAEVQYYSWFGDLPAALVLRAGVQTPIPGNLLLTVDVERNPLLTGRDAGWVPVVKLEHSLVVPTGALRSALRGVVYEDRNGNGERDPGEPGIAGVVVRRGGESVVTGRDGEFTFRSREEAPVRIDETSLPFGLVANPKTSTKTADDSHITIGVWPTAVVVVRLVPTADETGRLPQVDLRSASVHAVDQAGESWSAAVDSTGRAHFDAIPPGTYRLELDVSSVREPVRIRGTLPTFTVTPGQDVPVILVPLIPRPVRLFDPTNQRGRGTAQGGGAGAGTGQP